MKVQQSKVVVVVLVDDDRTMTLVGVCGIGVRRGTVQTLLEPGEVWRSAGFAARILCGNPGLARSSQRPGLNPQHRWG